jgi:hypothetical protein
MRPLAIGRASGSVQTDHPSGRVGLAADQALTSLGDNAPAALHRGGQLVDRPPQPSLGPASHITQGAAGVIQHRVRIPAAALGQVGQLATDPQDGGLRLLFGRRAAQP